MPTRVVAPGALSVVVETLGSWCREVPLRGAGEAAIHAQAMESTRMPADCPRTARGAQTTRRAIANGSVEHILRPVGAPLGHWARRAARSRGIPYSVWALGSDIWSLGRLPIVRAVLRTVIRDAANRYADGLKLGDDAAEHQRQAVRIPSQYASHRRPSFTTNRFGTTLTVCCFLVDGTANKGVDLLLDALAQLSDEDWARSVAGDMRRRPVGVACES